jgi:hypothetical protein
LPLNVGGEIDAGGVTKGVLNVCCNPFTGDIFISRHFWFRPVGADYFLTRFKNNIFGNGFFTPNGVFVVTGNGDTTTRNNFRYTAGLNFTWGEPK